MTVSYYRVLLILLAIVPFASVPKIFFSFPYFPLFSDLIFFLLVIYCVIKFPPKNINILFLFSIFYNFIVVLSVFFSSIPGLYNNFIAFRLSGLYQFAFFLPFFIRWSDKLLINLVDVSMRVSIIVGLNGIRQWMFPFDKEINFANDAGGAAKFLGDSYQGGDNSFRIFSTFITSVHLVTYMELIFFLSCSMIVICKNKSKVVVLSLIISFVCIVLTFSRSGWLSFFIGLLPIIVILLKYGGVLYKFKMYFFVFMLSSSAFLIFGENELISSRVSSLNDISDVSSFNSRLFLWERRMDEIKENPMGLGIGAAGWNLHDVMNKGADSNYIKFFLELGYFGGVISIIFLILIAYYFIKFYLINISNKNSSIMFSVFLALFCFFISVIVQMITNQVLEAYPSNLFFWFYCGLGSVLITTNKKYNKRA